MINLASTKIITEGSKAQIALNQEFLAIPFRTNINVVNLNETNDCELIVLEGHQRNISALLFNSTSDDDNVLISASYDYIIQWKCNAIRFAFAQNGHKVKGQVLCNSPGYVTYICVQPFIDYLAACVDKNIYIYNTKNKKHLVTLEGHDSLVTAAEFSPFYDSTLISISHDRTFKVWGLSSMSLLFQSAIISSSPFISISCNPFHNSVAFGTADGIIRIFDLSDDSGFKQLHKIDMPKLLQHNKYINKEIKDDKIDESPRVINAKKNMIIKNTERNEDQEDEFEVGTSILQLHFFNNQLSQNDFKNFKDIRNILDISSIILLIITNGVIVILDFNNFEIISCFNLEDKILAVTSEKYIVGAVSNAMISRTLTSDYKLICACEKLFSNEVDVICIPMLTNDYIKRSSSPTATWQHNSQHNNISVLSGELLDSKSPLKSQLVLKASKPLNIKEKANIKKKAIENQPVTFHSKIKSTGYITTINKSNSKKYNDTASQIKPKTEKNKLNYGKITNLENAINVTEKPMPISVIKMNYNGDKLACGLNDGLITIINCSSNCLNIKCALPTSNAIVNSLNWSNNGNQIIVASDDRSAYMFSSNNAIPLLTINNVEGNMDLNENNKNNVFTNSIRHAQFFYMDQFFIITCEKKFNLYKFYIDNIKSDLKRYANNSKYKLVQSFESGCAQTISALSGINSFYSYIVLTVGTNKTLEVFDLNKSMQCLSIHDLHTKTPHTLIQNSLGSSSYDDSAVYDLFLTSAVGDCIKLWDLRSASCVRRFEGHLNKIHKCGLNFSPCGKYITTASEDRNVYIYDIRKSVFLHKLSGNSDIILDVEYNHKYNKLYASTIDGKILTYSA